MNLQAVDLREWASPVEDQWQLGSCTAQAVIGAYELLLKMHYPDQFVDLSRLFLYYNARKLVGDINEDIGAYISTAIEAIEKYGLCREDLWPYDIHKYRVEPNWRCYHDGSKRTITNVREILLHDDILAALDSMRPVVVGVALYDEFNHVDTKSTILPMPRNPNDVIGSHAMCIVGYDNVKQLFLLRNSFGNDWAESGYFWIPYTYARENFSDMWAFDVDLKGNT
jgi:C1A family cysteine protease